MAGKRQVVYNQTEIFTILAGHAMLQGKLPRPSEGDSGNTVSPNAKVSGGELTITLTVDED